MALALLKDLNGTSAVAIRRLRGVRARSRGSQPAPCSIAAAARTKRKLFAFMDHRSQVARLAPSELGQGCLVLMAAGLCLPLQKRRGWRRLSWPHTKWNAPKRWVGLSLNIFAAFAGRPKGALTAASCRPCLKRVGATEPGRKTRAAIFAANCPCCASGRPPCPAAQKQGPDQGFEFCRELSDLEFGADKTLFHKRFAGCQRPGFELC